jgi:anti-anti-sigma regulatory factor
LVAAPQPPQSPLQGADIRELCDRIRQLIAQPDASHVVCDVSTITAADLLTIDALARLALMARRLGCDLEIRNPSAALSELLVLVGLAEALLAPAPSGLEAVGQAEQREESGRVEEERDPADPAV